MSNDALVDVFPFGRVSCQLEVDFFKDNYKDFYFFEAPFNEESLQSSRYLIIGRRGAGKSSLAHFFSFQTAIAKAKCIYVDEPELYSEVLHRLVDQPDLPNEIVIPRIRKIWEYLIWKLLYREYDQVDPHIISPAQQGTGQGKPSNLIRTVVEGLVASFLRPGDGRLADNLEGFLESDELERLKHATRILARQSPVLLAIDSLEHYSTDNITMMRSVAALISAASSFNAFYSADCIHVKVFLSGEVFPYLWENVVENPGKQVRSPLWLHWRPKDLIRLVCWRFYQYLLRDGYPELSRLRIDWNVFASVKAAIWTPYFGGMIENRNGRIEESFAYVLRHTQMRPRQLVHLCNEIALAARRAGTFPNFSAEVIRDALLESEAGLAVEVLNSYTGTYPGVAGIVNALVGLPRVFKGSELDRVAPRTASEWQHERYSPVRFRELVAELGIVGRVRNYDEKTGFAATDFEYSLPNRLALQVDDLCAIHPMFYQRLHTGGQVNAIVYPFPDHPEYKSVQPGR